MAPAHPAQYWNLNPGVGDLQVDACCPILSRPLEGKYLRHVEILSKLHGFVQTQGVGHPFSILVKNFNSCFSKGNSCQALGFKIGVRIKQVLLCS